MGRFDASSFVRELAVIVRKNRQHPEPLESFIGSVLFRAVLSRLHVAGHKHKKTEAGEPTSVVKMKALEA